MRISQAKWYDNSAIRKLEQRVWKEKDISGKYETGILARFEYVFVAKEKKKIVGAILAMKTATDEIYVTDIIVDPLWQHLGIAKKLYQTLIAACGNAALLALVDTANEHSIALHKELGFKGVKKIKDPFGVALKSTSFLMRREAK